MNEHFRIVVVGDHVDGPAHQLKLHLFGAFVRSMGWHVERVKVLEGKLRRVRLRHARRP